MEFCGFNLTQQSYVPQSFSSKKMSDSNMYSYPLTGHLDERKSETWNLPPKTYLSKKMSDPNICSYPLPGHREKSSSMHTWSIPPFASNLKIAMPCMLPPPGKFDSIGKITCVVGGFVGSKSQRNGDNEDLFPLGKLISKSLDEQRKSCNTSSQKSTLLHGVMSSIFMQRPSVPEPAIINGFGVEIPETEKDKDATKKDVHAGACLGAAIRLLSECSVESNDSDFIVFDGEDVCQLSDYEDDWSDEFDCDGEDDRIREACEKWNSYYGSTEVLDVDDSMRKVRFDPEPKIHVMCVWDHASRAARIGPWEEAARDRARFSQRIARTEEILSPILTQSHRNKIRTLHSDR